MKKVHEPCFFKALKSPIGTLIIVAANSGLKEILFQKEAKNWKDAYLNLKAGKNYELLKKAKKQLTEYFEKKRRVFNLPLAPEGTEFQKKTWKALLKIPYGRTISYSEQAKKIGNTKKARAVGAANGKNPIAIVLPCHRVIGKNGTLTGYTGGIDKKLFLLSLEKEDNL